MLSLSFTVNLILMIWQEHYEIPMIHNMLWKSTQVPDIDIISTSNRWKRSLQESSSGKSLASDITSQLTTTKTVWDGNNHKLFHSDLNHQIPSNIEPWVIYLSYKNCWYTMKSYLCKDAKPRAMILHLKIICWKDN